MSSPVVNYDFENYGFRCCKSSKCPLLTCKRSHLIHAIVQNHTQVLIRLLDSPDLYDTQDRKGFDLLQIAIASDNQDAFDFLMTLDNYPIEHKNKAGLTALGVALNYYMRGDIHLKEHYALKLIRKGANFDIECRCGNTPLHCALERNYIEVATFLIQSGVDLNSENIADKTPLDLVLQCIDNPCTRNEMFAMLVVNGAEVNSSMLDYVLESNKSFPAWVQDTVFFYLFDEVSETEVDLDALLNIANDHIDYFRRIIQYNIVITPPKHTFLCHQAFHSLSYENFLLIVRKFGDSLNLMFEDTEYLFYYWCANDINVEYLGFLIENGFKSELIDTFQMMDHCYTLNIYMDRYSYEPFEQLYCFFLSYDLRVSERDIQIVYRRYGYCSLFKILLYMEITMMPISYFFRDPTASFIYDVTMDLDKFFKTSHTFQPATICGLLKHFSNPRLKRLCANLRGDEFESEGNKPLQLPSLSELARNEFRKHFVKVFNIKTSCRFYTLLNHLPISSVYKKIISFEKSLY